ncbi:MAG: hypothetical protein UT84_C0012G0012 [Candidatus Curtissbacteria bacterium GW2011_GWA1_40_16]|uniref:DNA primase/polymerase bifunctional N-terminal domain-containing protein n=1 Tax=Candidatus Curtissbacteria bacterium GW2011_GWA1_40_16 TaxID=1618405 RepID=A0A0G0RC63_9BACT|nr:MAG: hypothetical protein UT84_C0012G0012 [Candidatus Curtissbacteria bacterium GW2011_GWA1_40_16]
MNTPEHRQEVLNQALKYLEHGFSVIPVGRDKKPLIKSWAEYQNRKPTENEVRQWWFELEPAGVAIITGKISNLVVLDVEKGADMSSIVIPNTPTVATGGGGKHYYFKRPNKDIQNAARFMPLMDIRGDGGYVLTAPSLHVSGNNYEWITGLDTPLAEMPEWMDTKLQKTTSVQKKPLQTIGEWEDITHGVEEGRRHDAAVRIVGKLIAHIPRRDRDSVVLPLLEAWNERNTPPLPDDELWKIFDDIRERHEKGEAVNEYTPKERKLLTVADLLAYEPSSHPFLVDPLVPHRGISAISGHPGVGKSWVMLEVAKAVASGKPLFGKYPTLKGGVLIVDEEGGLDEMWKRVKMLDYTADMPIFFYIVNGFKLDNENDLARLIGTVRKNDISLVILDPYVALHSKPENSAEDTAKVMEAMQQFTIAGAAVLFVHHLRKDSIAKFGFGQALRGSSAILGRLDSLIVVRQLTNDDVSDELEIRHEKARRGRKEPVFQIPINWDNGKAVFGSPLEIEPAKRKVEVAIEAIAGMFEEDTELSRKEILAFTKKETGVGDKNASDGLRTMVKDKLLVEFQKGREKYYRLTIQESGAVGQSI